MAEDYLKMYKDALTRLSTGGQALQASLQEIEEGKKQAIAGGQQALVSGGLGGTTVMGGVPVQAEKIAARQRLGARGQAEQTYLTTLASFAAFAQRGEEAEKQRQFEAEQAEIARKAAMTYESRVDYGGGTGGGGYGGGTGGGLAPSIPRTMTSMGPTTARAQQFPSIYGDGGGAEQPGQPKPDWAGDKPAEGAWEPFSSEQMYQVTMGDGTVKTMSKRELDALQQSLVVTGRSGGSYTYGMRGLGNVQK